MLVFGIEHFCQEEDTGPGATAKEIYSMKLTMDDELRGIARGILNESSDITFWRAHEASDWIQTYSYCGGFDATEDAFTFSDFRDVEERWFQFRLESVEDIASGHISELEARLAET